MDFALYLARMAACRLTRDSMGHHRQSLLRHLILEKQMLAEIHTYNLPGLIRDVAGAGILTVCRCQLSDGKV